jgi:cyclopropane fatty-acyl-phospholipid synthase-like methyltransferase
MTATRMERPMLEIDLPYFDQILEHLNRDPDSELAAAFERHVHWGCFERPGSADDSLEGYVAAAEALTRRVVEACGIHDGQRILDVGCGFGGAVDHVAQRVQRSVILGLNIDVRQVVRASRLVGPRPTNSIGFVAADACHLPIADGVLHSIMAIECVFHFPSRRQFFREVARTLRPGGRMALSDFISGPQALEKLVEHQQSDTAPKSDFYGQNARPLTIDSYRRLARGAGLELQVDQDITTETLPTYAAMRKLYREAGLLDGERATDELEALARGGLLEYHILAFEKPATATGSGTTGK